MVMFRRFRRASGDAGAALVSVIGAMLVVGVVVTTLVATSIANVRVTTESRSSSEARAVAEAGIAQVQAMLGAKSCPTGGVVNGTVGGGSFAVEIHPSDTAAASAADAVGCPTATTASVFLSAKGTAAQTSVGGGPASRTMQALLARKVASSPLFGAAIYSGQNMDVNTNLALTGTDADIFTDGNFRCSTAASIQGSVLATGKVTFSSTPCTVEGDVYSDEFECSNASVIKGGLYARGKANFSTQWCTFSEDVWIGGDVAAARGIKTAGELKVRGNPPVNNATSELPLASNVTVGGKIGNGVGASNYNLMLAKYPLMQQYAAVDMPPKAIDVKPTTMPKVDQSHSIFTGWTKKSWKASVEPLRSSNIPACDLNWGGNHFSGTLKVTSPTIFDTTTATECNNGMLKLGAGLKLELSADMVIFAKSFDIAGDVTITSGDGLQHSLYFITPYPASQTSCTSNVDSARTITYTTGTWNQSSKVALLVYATGGLRFHMSPGPQIYGQMYSCKVEMNTAVKLHFTQAGATDDSASKAQMSVTYLRDAG
ncbi:hypothetical protein [Sanguibacter massiliensis]|uniref:hypothetical protein n=1 Tax=Sanguibacter massiliensis TaxID=1973217 RepID=UPI000C8314DD|nr:hypothetical protein [Sanguibacter massiliensis]